MESVSVVVPAYNEAERIEATIVSIRSQTVKPQQLIVINDNSADQTEQTALELGTTVVRAPPWSRGSKAGAPARLLPMWPEKEDKARH